MARLSLYAHPHLRNSSSYFGYAYTFNEINKHMPLVKVDGQPLNVGLNSPKARTQLHYGTPPGTFYDHQFKILMVQWESTAIPQSWIGLLSEYDEVWTANVFGANAFVNSGLNFEKVHIFEHGIDFDTWKTCLRGQNEKIRFLHIDSGSPRKRADIARRAFKAAFKDNPSYELTLKFSHCPSSGVDWTSNEILRTRGNWDRNVREIHENLSLQELVSLYHFHDVLIYPSEGEGFGLIPFQAIATGMPMISTALWCSYSDFFPETIIDSHLGKSDIQENYDRPGDVVIPDFESTVALMLEVAQKIDKYSDESMRRVASLKQKYEWTNLCQGAIDGLVGRHGKDILGAYLGYMQ